MKETNEKRDVYQVVTDRITSLLESGVVPWRKPWTEAGLPQNLITKRSYRGINVWLLASYDFTRNFFLTPKQLKDLGGIAKEKEKPVTVVFWEWKDLKDEESKETKQVPFIRYYSVYNVEQCD